MGFDTIDQFQAATIEAQRETTAAVERLTQAVAELGTALGQRIAPIEAALAQLDLSSVAPLYAPQGTNGVHPSAGTSNGTNVRAQAHSRRLDGHGQELPRGISWDARGDVWTVDVSLPGQARRRVRIPGERFAGRPDAALAEACHVRAYLRGEEVRRHFTSIHPETALDCAEAMATS